MPQLPVDITQLLMYPRHPYHSFPEVLWYIPRICQNRPLLPHRIQELLFLPDGHHKAYHHRTKAPRRLSYHQGSGSLGTAKAKSSWRWALRLHE